MAHRIHFAMPRRKLPSSRDTGFATRMAELRQQRGLTQVQLAEKMNASQRTISHYETGAGYPPAPVIAELAQALEVTTDQLLGVDKRTSRAKSKTNGHSHAGQVPHDPKTRRLWRKLQKVADLPEKDQRAVIRLINSLSQQHKDQ